MFIQSPSIKQRVITQPYGYAPPYLRGSLSTPGAPRTAEEAAYQVERFNRMAKSSREASDKAHELRVRLIAGEVLTDQEMKIARQGIS